MACNRRLCNCSRRIESLQEDGVEAVDAFVVGDSLWKVKLMLLSCKQDVTAGCDVGCEL